MYVESIRQFKFFIESKFIRENICTRTSMAAFSKKTLKNLTDMGAPLFNISMKFEPYEIDPKNDIEHTERIQEFDPDLNNPEDYHLHCIEFAHNEVEEFGLTSAIQVL